MSAELVDFIYKWKEITGAIIGGLFSLGVALIVARDARTRENRSASTLLIVTFTNLLARHASLTDLEKGQSVPAQDRHKWLSEKLAKSGPKLSPLAEAALARLLPINAALAAHLELFRTLHGELESHTERISQNYREFHEHGKAFRSADVMEADAKIVVSAFDCAAKHAECAAYLLEKLVLSHFPTWNYIRMRLFPTQKNRVCQCLRNGIDAQPIIPTDAAR
jgi:hypothetical protein